LFVVILLQGEINIKVNIQKIKKFVLTTLKLDSVNERSQRAKRNIAGSFLLKGMDIVIGIILVPIAINYLQPAKYGVWITISSIVGWLGFFDIGLGNGLRNKFAEAVALGKIHLARVYVSTSYAILTITVTLLIIAFFITNMFLNWNSILNAPSSLVPPGELSLVILIVFTFFLIRFVLSLISTILLADQKVVLSSLIKITGKLLAFFAILFIVNTSHSNLLLYSIVFSCLPVVVLLFANIWFFRREYSLYKPSVKFVDFSIGKSLMSLGGKFFIIQIAVVLMYQTNYIIISRVLGSTAVTEYNIVFKYFSVIFMFFTIIVAPFWSAFTEAWAKKDIQWIKKIMGKLIKVWVILAIIGSIMLASSKLIFKIWVGDEIQITFGVSLLVLLFALINAWNSIFSHFLNGVGIVKLQMYLGITSALVNVPLAIKLGRMYGLKGVLIANIVVSVLAIIVYPYQYNQIINKKAKGFMYD